MQMTPATSCTHRFTDLALSTAPVGIVDPTFLVYPP